MDGRAPIADTYILVCISLQLIHPLASRFLLQYGHAKWLHYAWDEVSMEDTKSSCCGPSFLEIMTSARDRGILVGTSVVAQHSGTESLTTRRRHPYVHAYVENIADG